MLFKGFVTLLFIICLGNQLLIHTRRGILYEQRVFFFCFFHKFLNLISRNAISQLKAIFYLEGSFLFRQKKYMYFFYPLPSLWCAVFYHLTSLWAISCHTDPSLKSISQSKSLHFLPVWKKIFNHLHKSCSYFPKY